VVSCLLTVPVTDAALGQVIRRQFNSHSVAGKHLYIVFAHLPGQMGQDFVPLANLDLEGSIAFAFDYSPVDGDHIFFRNTSPLSKHKPAEQGASNNSNLDSDSLFSIAKKLPLRQSRPECKNSEDSGGSRQCKLRSKSDDLFA